MRCVAGRHELVFAADRLKRCQALKRCVGTVACIGLYSHLPVAKLARDLVFLRHGYGAWHDLVPEARGFLRGGSSLLAGQGELILRVARYPVTSRHHVRCLDHGHIELRHVCDNPRVLRCLAVRCRRNTRDALHTTGNHRVCPVRDDPCRRVRDRAEPRRTEPVDGHSRHVNWKSCPDRCLARHVPSCRTLRIPTAEHDVLDQSRIDLRSLHRGTDSERRKLRPGRHVEFTTVGFCHRGARGGDNYGFTLHLEKIQ